MTIIRVKGFQIFDDRHGRTRCYHRKTRTAIDLNKKPIGSAEFFAECARIAALGRREDGQGKTRHTRFANCDTDRTARFKIGSPTKSDYQKIRLFATDRRYAG